MRLPKGASGGQSGVTKAATSRTIAVFGQLLPFFLTRRGLPAARTSCPGSPAVIVVRFGRGPAPPALYAVSSDASSSDTSSLTTSMQSPTTL